jgi:hypothetical protein
MLNQVPDGPVSLPSSWRDAANNQANNLPGLVRFSRVFLPGFAIPASLIPALLPAAILITKVLWVLNAAVIHRQHWEVGSDNTLQF